MESARPLPSTSSPSLTLANSKFVRSIVFEKCCWLAAASSSSSSTRSHEASSSVSGALAVARSAGEGVHGARALHGVRAPPALNELAVTDTGKF
ncbi:hypothetical protein TcasGA2_TC034970 [Tribolium castaneum]|uniref:Uncharacterized protein n=1 Tax=Tribolium castaneum TaxID=7070 RepID=A0A139W9L1_TRICA|nr:hypothetical protein TcasGA2_TC034970 [Tribolium castaneum]